MNQSQAYYCPSYFDYYNKVGAGTETKYYRENQ